MEKLPKGIILAAHKPIASAMLKAATQIMGQIDHCAAADIDSDAGEKEQFEHLKKVWESVQTDEMIILLDIEGATPCNVLKKYISGKMHGGFALEFSFVLQNAYLSFAEFRRTSC